MAGIGATGFAADAIYHLLAYEMVQPGIERAAMVPLMARFQSADLVFVAPQLLALLLGLGLVSFAPPAPVSCRARTPGSTSPRSRWPWSAESLPTQRGEVVELLAMSVLALFSLAVAWVGVALVRVRSRGGR